MSWRRVQGPRRRQSGGLPSDAPRKRLLDHDEALRRRVIADLSQGRTPRQISGHRAGEVRTFARKREFNTSPGVEMRGIEPRSDSNATGLLRVQFAKEFLSLSVSRKLGRLEQAQSTKSPLIPIDKELKQWLSK